MYGSIDMSTVIFAAPNVQHYFISTVGSLCAQTAATNQLHQASTYLQREGGTIYHQPSSAKAHINHSFHDLDGPTLSSHTGEDDNIQRLFNSSTKALTY